MNSAPAPARAALERKRASPRYWPESKYRTGWSGKPQKRSAAAKSRIGSRGERRTAVTLPGYVIRPRVALIGPASGELGGAPGGVGTHQQYLARGLAGTGLDVSLLTTNVRSERPDDPPARDVLPLYRMSAPRSIAGWLEPRYLRAVTPRRLIRYALYAQRQAGSAASRRVLLAELLSYARYLRTVQPNVIHVQHPLERQTYVSWVCKLEGWRIPLVVTIHSLFGEHPDALIHDVMAPNLQRADRLIAVSTHVADHAVQLGADPTRIRVIPSGVDTQRFRPINRATTRATLGLSSEQKIILFVGTLEPRKQVDRLLLALPLVRQRIPLSNVVIIGTGEVAGAGDQTALLHRVVRENNLEDVVRFEGRVSEEQLVSWYTAADVFALPSSSEGQGLAALEAMACGLPVVASAVGGLLEAIVDGHNGALVRPGDVSALAQRLTDVLQDECLRERLGSAARETAIQRYSWDRTVADTIAVYNELLSTFDREAPTP